MPATPQSNEHPRTISGFGAEWGRFDQSAVPDHELAVLFDRYFSLVDPARLHEAATVLDVGCGSGRWARFVAPKVGRLILVDASPEALEVARRATEEFTNCEHHVASVDSLPVEDESVDLVYSLGVLHHVPDTQAAIRSCAGKVKPGGLMLLYLYYRFDNRPAWFRLMWRCSDLVRLAISGLPFGVRRRVTDLIAASVYFPLARLARAGSRMGRQVSAWPLSYYRDSSFYTMRTDALDRFGTRLEQRFTRAEIEAMLTSAGLVDIRFRESEPFWCVKGSKR